MKKLLFIFLMLPPAFLWSSLSFAQSSKGKPPPPLQDKTASERINQEPMGMDGKDPKEALPSTPVNEGSISAPQGNPPIPGTQLTPNTGPKSTGGGTTPNAP